MTGLEETGTLVETDQRKLPDNIQIGEAYNNVTWDLTGADTQIVFDPTHNENVLGRYGFNALNAPNVMREVPNVLQQLDAGNNVYISGTEYDQNFGSKDESTQMGIHNLAKMVVAQELIRNQGRDSELIVLPKKEPSLNESGHESIQAYVLPIAREGQVLVVKQIMLLSQRMVEEPNPFAEDKMIKRKHTYAKPETTISWLDEEEVEEMKKQAKGDKSS